ncbi:MAG: hypothetical protein GF405_06245 [Candidatus Eisenbacteria bacterium]|nr:hypothetical protein [Candidatus Eisenbacteria bacterium]
MRSAMQPVAAMTRPQGGHMRTKLVVHVNLEDEARLIEALANIRNLLDEVGEDRAQVVLVANGGVVKLLPPGKNEKAGGVVEKLKRRGVTFRVCGNALRYYEIERSDLPDAWEVVPAGIVDIAALQQDGFAYVKP